jgi:exodeoxyribonuclease VII small subunit
MAQGNADEIRTFAEARERLEEIVGLVRDKDLPLEKSLDLFEEAIKLGNRCSDLIDDATFSPEEAELAAAGDAAASEPAPSTPAES